MTKVERVLIVDENESNILLFQVVLQGLGIPYVYTANNGQDGLELVEREKIQLVITAWEMKGMPGTILIQKIKSNRRSMYVPCLIYSKRMDESEVKLTKELGFQDILGMPFNKEAATTILQEMITKEEEVSPLEIKIRKIEGFISENKPAEALKLVDPSVTKKSPFRPRVKTALGEIWLMVNQYKKSEVILNEALEDNGDYVPAKYMLARLYSVVGRHEEAIALLEDAAKSSPHNIMTLLGLGSAYVDADQHDKAKGIFEKVDKIDPDCKELKDERGKLAFKEGDIPLAAQLLSQTQNGDMLARHFNNAAIAETAAGRYEKAINTYQNALKILADRAKVHLLTFNLALAYRKAGDIVKSFEYMCESYILDPSFEKAYNSLAKLSQELKEKNIELNKELIRKVKNARNDFKKSLEAQTQNVA